MRKMMMYTARDEHRESRDVVYLLHDLGRCELDGIADTINIGWLQV